MRIVIQREIEQGHTPENEVQIYTWMNATLGELTQLIKEVNPDTRRRGTIFFFNFASHGTYGMGWDCPIPRGALVAILQKRQEQVVSNPRRDRLPQQSSEDNNKRRSGPANEKNGGGLVRSAQKK
ncbi:unnamed protein product [Rotaria socialis]